MMRNPLLHAILLILLFCSLSFTSFGQGNVLEFYMGGISFNDPADHDEADDSQLNTPPGEGFGPDRWVVNRDKRGRGIYPPTPSQNNVRDGQATAPDSGYLHISSQEVASEAEILSAQFVHGRSSQRLFVLPIDICTKDFDEVVFSMIWVGSPSLTGEDPDTVQAYGELLYSLEGGPWIPVKTKFGNSAEWRYYFTSQEDWLDKISLRFALRWRNNGTLSAPGISFGVDDIILVGKIKEADINKYCADRELINQVRVVAPINACTQRVEVCAGRPFQFEFAFTKTVCPSATQIFLSNARGEFGDGQLSLGQFNAGGIQPGVLLRIGDPNLRIPISADSSDCYRIRLVWRHPYVGSIQCTSTVSLCFKVSKCTQQIQTVQIPMASKAAPPERDTLCAGSIVTVPFWNPRLNNCTEDGDFNESSNYLAEFYRKEKATDPDPPLGQGEWLIGTNADNRLYRTRCAPGGPGIVGGIVPDQIEESCNWYARVSATDPEVAGKPWGPFCIKHCHIETNDKQSVRVCINECEAAEAIVRLKLGAYTESLRGLQYSDRSKFIFEMHQIPDPCFREWTKVGTDDIMSKLVGSSSTASDGDIILKVPPLFGYPSRKNPNPSPENPDSCLGPYTPPSVTELLQSPAGGYFMRIVSTDPVRVDPRTGEVFNLGPGERSGTIVNMSYGSPFVNCHSFIVNNELIPEKVCAGEQVQLAIGVKKFLAAKQSNYQIFWMDDLSIVDGSGGRVRRPSNPSEESWRNYQASLDKFADSMRVELDKFGKYLGYPIEPLGLVLNTFRWGPTINGRFGGAINAPNPWPVLGPVAGTSGPFALPIRIDEQVQRVLRPDGTVEERVVTRYPGFTYLIVREENGGCFSNASIIRFPVYGPPEFTMTDTVLCTSDSVMRSITFRPETYYTWEVSEMDVVPPINFNLDTIDYRARAQRDGIDISTLNTLDQAILLTSKYSYPVRALNFQTRRVFDQNDTNTITVGNNRVRLKGPAKGIYKTKARGLNRCGIVVDSCYVVVQEGPKLDKVPSAVYNCLGDPAAFSPESNIIPKTAERWSWHLDKERASIHNEREFQAEPEVDTRYRVEVLDTQSKCIARAFTKVYVAEVKFKLAEDTTFCLGESLNVGIDTRLVNPQWTVQPSTQASSIRFLDDRRSNALLTPTDTAKYIVKVEQWVHNGLKKCEGIDSMQINIFKPEKNEDIIFACDTLKVVTLDPQKPSARHRWRYSTKFVDRGTNPTLDVSYKEPGIYQVWVSDPKLDNCESIYRYDVRFLPSSAFSVKDTIRDCDRFSKLLDADIFDAKYLWSTGDTTKTIVVYSPGIYSVEVIAPPCSLDKEIILSLDIPCTIAEIDAPNAFTPNGPNGGRDGDGVNDNWVVWARDVYQFHVRIYDRWGRIAFETQGDQFSLPRKVPTHVQGVPDMIPLIEWDGVTPGETIPKEGVYVYVIDYVLKGDFDPTDQTADLSKRRRLPGKRGQLKDTLTLIF
jgi:hypothetical protein